LQEVGSIIGKKGEIVKRFREEVWCKILICISFRILICKMTRLLPRTFCSTLSVLMGLTLWLRRRPIYLKLLIWL